MPTIHTPFALQHLIDGMNRHAIAETVASSVLETGKYGLEVLRKTLILYRAEQDGTFRDQVPLPTRLRWYRHGFTTEWGVLYDFDTYGYDDYVNYIEYDRRDRANGNAQAFPVHKYPYAILMERFFPGVHPTVYGLLKDGMVYDDRFNRVSENPAEWLADTLDEVGRLVVKPQDAYGGEGVHVLDADDIAALEDPDLREEIRGTDTPRVVVDYVEQAPYADRIFPGSVNTIRVVSLWNDETEEPYVADAIHRFGVEASSPVDNWDSGGLSAAIDLETGELLQATRAPDSPGLEWFSTHPDTGADIEGVEIPKWDEISEACRRFAEAFWYLPMIAWDIVLTDDEEIALLEANSRPSMDLMQVHRPLLRDDRTKRFFARHRVIER